LLILLFDNGIRAATLSSHVLNSHNVSKLLISFASITTQDRMASDFQTAFEVLRGSVTEGRAENVRYRQNELYSLHLVLRENAEPICEAITKDYAGPTVKAETEFFLAMDAVRISYERLDFDKSMAEEYFVKFGKDNRERRASLGLVAIRPLKHNRFYSVITPLVAALQAGNCVIVEVRYIPSIFEQSY